MNGKLVVFQEGFDEIHGVWGATDAAILWVDAEGLMAHRAKRIEIRRPGLASISITSDDMPFDVDVSILNGELVGHIASEKPTGITLLYDGKLSTMRPYGITLVDTRDMTPRKA